jgi:2-keto-4-pentenoate hydratase/2-oxohepta-3-ene-1,7-dioic acid hydratase in catechol pathway
METKKSLKKFCRFIVDARTYNGAVRGNMIDIVEGDLFGDISDMRMSFPADRVKFLPPITPTKIWCVGVNYASHMREMGHEPPREPLIFMKPRTTVAGSGDPVRIPEWAGRVDYEGELAVVIGKKCRNVSEFEALSFVKGYSCYNDVTARDLQTDNNWIRAKGFDNFGPFGPSILVTEKMPDETKITTRLNGSVMQQDTIASMIFPVRQIISFISRFATLEPGDVIATGTPAGVGRVKPGDRVEVEIEGIGVLANPFISD